MLCNNLFTLLRCCRIENSANHFENPQSMLSGVLSECTNTNSIMTVERSGRLQRNTSSRIFSVFKNRIMHAVCVCEPVVFDDVYIEYTDSGQSTTLDKKSRMFKQD